MNKQDIKLILEALVCSSVYRKVGKVNIDGRKFSYSVTYRNRYYSPVFILIAIGFIPVFIIDGGLKEWVRSLFTCTSVERKWSGEFKEGTSKRKMRLTLWVSIYTDI